MNHSRIVYRRSLNLMIYQDGVMVGGFPAAYSIICMRFIAIVNADYHPRILHKRKEHHECSTKAYGMMNA